MQKEHIYLQINKYLYSLLVLQSVNYISEDKAKRTDKSFIFVFYLAPIHQKQIWQDGVN